jgi:protein CpxP
MKTVVTTILATCFIATAHAQTPAAPTPAVQTKMDAQRDLRVEKHIRELHAKLKITAAEEASWAAVAKTMRESAGELDSTLDKRDAMIGTASAIDDLNAYADIAQAHADSVKKLSAAFAPLYGSMPDDQKRLADEVFTQREHHDKKMSKLEK